MKTLLTTKQRQVLRVIIEGDLSTERGQRVPVDMNRLLELIPYETSKQSMQFTVRALVKNGLIYKANYETRRGRQRVCFEATDLAKNILKVKLESVPGGAEKVSRSEGTGSSVPGDSLSLPQDSLDLDVDLFEGL